MERRQFLSRSSLAMMGLPALATLLQSSPAMAAVGRKMVIDIPDEKITNNDADYASWDKSPLTPGGQIRTRVLFESDEAGNEAVCKMIRFAVGVKVPRHLHPEGELTCVLAGTFIQEVDSTHEEVRYTKGDVIWMPAGSIHGVASVVGDVGVTILTFFVAKFKCRSTQKVKSLTPVTAACAGVGVAALS